MILANKRSLNQSRSRNQSQNLKNSPNPSLRKTPSHLSHNKILQRMSKYLKMTTPNKIVN